VTAPTTCSRCSRPLTAPLAVAAGVGARCALLDLAETVALPVAGVTVPHARVAVALVAAFLGEHAQDVHDGILSDANPYDVAGILAATTARVLARTEGGEDLLRRLGLAAAQGTAR
jgi:hypothetical protein